MSNLIPCSPKRRFGTRSSTHHSSSIATAATAVVSASTPPATALPKSISASGSGNDCSMGSTTAVGGINGINGIGDAGSIDGRSLEFAATMALASSQQPAQLLQQQQKKNISLNSLPNVVEGVALDNRRLRNGGAVGAGMNANAVGGAAPTAGLSTVSSPTAMMSAPLEQQLRQRNGASIQNLAEAINAKGLIVEDESTTDWIPEIPFKNVSRKWKLNVEVKG